MDRALLWFVRIWIGIAIAINVIAVAGFFMSAQGFWDGWHKVAEIYSPFNLINWLAEVVLISPAVGAYAWLERRRKRRLMSAQEAQQIVNAYGAAMAEPGGMVVGKIAEQKERIRQALLKVTPPGPARDQKIQQFDEAIGGMVRDVGTLPYPKERIKQALLTAIVLTPPGPDRERLTCGFVMLGDWQDPRSSDPAADMLAEGKALLAELRALGL
jgi:membrane protein implicated in regulation of membrane protease activity